MEAISLIITISSFILMLAFGVIKKIKLKQVYYNIFLVVILLKFIEKEIYLEAFVIVCVFALIEAFTESPKFSIISSRKKIIRLLYSLSISLALVLVLMAKGQAISLDVANRVIGLLVILFTVKTILIAKGASWK